MQLSQASVLVQVSEEERYREWTLNSDQCLQSEGTNGKYMSPRLVSVSAIVVNEGGWCSGKNIKSGSKKQGFRTQLCHKDILGLWASLLNPPHCFLSLFFFFFGIFHVFHFISGSCIEYKMTNYDPWPKYDCHPFSTIKFYWDMARPTC